MRHFSIILISLLLSSSVLLAQQWGYKQDTVYYNSFDKESPSYSADTLYDETSLSASQIITNKGELVLHNKIRSRELLEVPLVNEAEATERVEITINHKKSIGSYIKAGNYYFIIKEQGVSIKTISGQKVKPATTYIAFDAGKDTTTLIFDASYKNILSFQVNNTFAGFPWDGTLITQKIYVRPGKLAYIRRIELGSRAKGNLLVHNFEEETLRWGALNFRSDKVSAISTYADGKFVIKSSNIGSGFNSQNLYSLMALPNIKTNVILTGPFNNSSTVDFSLGGKKISIKGNRISFNNGNSQIYSVPNSNVGEVLNIRIYQKQITIILGSFVKSFNWQFENFNISYSQPSNSTVYFDELIHLQQVPKTFNDYVSDEADKELLAWKVKGEFEKTTIYNKRVSEENLRVKKSEFEQAFINKKGKEKIKCENITGTYNADNDQFTINWKGLNTVYVSIPPQQAKLVKGNFCNYSFVDPQFKYEDDAFHLISAALIVNNQRYLISDNPNAAPLVASRSGSSISSYKSKTVTTALQDKKYYLLVIANQDYPDPDIKSLNNPIEESNKLITTLTSLYNFRRENVSFLKNASRSEIFGEFDRLARIIKPEDNLMIYYAGHGIWDENLKRGYWLPVDASKDKRATWFSNSNLRDYIAGIDTKHTLLVSDACFSGSIFKTRSAFASNNLGMAELYSLNSRQAMTSGTLESVPDKSVFSQYLIKRLKENSDDMMSALELFNSFRIAVINNSPSGQKPQFGDIRETGDEGGEFIFIKK